MHTLVGAGVEFVPMASARHTDNVITRSRLDAITANSYKQPNPVDFLAAFRMEPKEERAEKDTSATDGEIMAASNASSEKMHLSSSTELFAGNIVVDFNSLNAHSQGDGMTARTEFLKGDEKDDAAEGVPAPLGLKDLRNAVVLDADTRELLRLRSRLGDERKAREALEKQREEERAAKARQRTVLATEQIGVVLAWSQLYRSGAVLWNVTTLPDFDVVSNLTVEECNGDVCIIRNVDAFDTALPSSLNLVGRVVKFTKVRYAAHPSKVFAENITVTGSLTFDGGLGAAQEEERWNESAITQKAKHTKKFGTLFEDMDDADDGPPPSGHLFGVVTRWSGGQGIVETGNRRLYYIRSAADFVQLIDSKSSSIRGAVVRFRVDKENRRNAQEVDVLSLAVRDLGCAAAALEEQGAPDPGGRGTRCRFHGNQRSSTDAEEPPADAEWVEGMVVTWSPLEAQGVIEGDNGIRYLIRDAEENIVDYNARKLLVGRGRRVRFIPSGIAGRLAANISLLDEESDEARIAEAELRGRESRLSEGNTEEAIASPMSTAYWINRMDKVGYDTTEVKRMQNKAITFEDDDDKDEKMLDSEDLFKKDHWFNDPRKNMRLPNSDVTAGNLALIGPASMMNIAMKAHDPKKLEKMKNKYYNRLTEPMKEYAWKQAKELAPKYEKRIKEAREKGEEPRFSFY
uniref:Uncharacterized protein TCIL3000_11_16370 n=1 Tax=Trypanosoma congolense (strain IL3000) TaxID=1068625 RepID=G0V3A2_TRYCI|nr:unnamed protein product [Trypanosoma congolense IL3000]